MMINRTILRLATVCALNNFGEEPWPTLAGKHIFDSKIEPIEDFVKDAAYPLVVVYTDYDTNFWTHHSSISPDRTRRITLTMELVVAQISEDNQEFQIGLPITDSEVETTLDVLEAQIFTAFSKENVAADCFRHLVTRYGELISRRGASVESGQRLAARQITIECEVGQDPLNGTVATPVQSFLDKLVGNADYGGRLSEFTRSYLRNAGLSDREQKLENLTLSDAAGGLLGFERGSQPVLGTPVQWLDPQGLPLS